MKIYLKHKTTSEIEIFEAESYLSLSKIIRDQYDEASQAEADNFELQEAKNAKIAQIEANKKDFIYLPVEYNGSTFINSEIASTNLQGAYTFAEEPIEWLDIEGDTVMLTKLQMADLANIMIAHRSSGYFQERDLKASINSIEVIEEVIVDGVVTVEGKTAQQCIEEVNNIDITFS